jgi:hypothetical protein
MLLSLSHPSIKSVKTNNWNTLTSLTNPSLKSIQRKFIMKTNNVRSNTNNNNNSRSNHD